MRKGLQSCETIRKAMVIPSVPPTLQLRKRVAVLKVLSDQPHLPPKKVVKL
jgi:hypothetical protein